MRVRRRTRAPGSLLPYWPGPSFLHRVPVGPKLLALAAGAVLVWLPLGPAPPALLLAAVLVLILAARVPARIVVGQVRPILWLVALLLAVQVVIGRPGAGVLAALRILAVAALAIGVTVTTSHTQMITVLERGLRRLRVGPTRVFRLGLTIGVALRSLDHLGVVAGRVVDARRARGLSRSLRAFAVPTVVAAARFAHGAGEALDARGIADPQPIDDPEAARST